MNENIKLMRGGSQNPKLLLKTLVLKKIQPLSAKSAVQLRYAIDDLEGEPSQN